MPFTHLTASRSLKINRYESVDHFQHVFSAVEATFVPLSAGPHKPAQAILRLPHCTAYIIRTYPRTIDACFNGGAMVQIGMEQNYGKTLNGVDIEFPTMTFYRGSVPHKMVERQSSINAAIIFDSPMRDRGWPDMEDRLQMFRLPRETWQRLRLMIQQAFTIASTESDQWCTSGLDEAMEQSMLELLDETFLRCSPSRFDQSASYGKQLCIANRVDRLLMEDPSAPIYSDALAQAAGVSLRTLHNAMIRWRGMSLHQYLRIRRLWMVRQKLLGGAPGLQVKHCAMAHGFWHLGEFAAAYSAQFGELPSFTLARANGESRSAVA